MERKSAAPDAPAHNECARSAGWTPLRKMILLVLPVGDVCARCFWSPGRWETLMQGDYSPPAGDTPLRKMVILLPQAEHPGAK